MPRHSQYSSNAERQKAYRLRQAKAAAARLAEHRALRTVVGAEADGTMEAVTRELTKANLQAPEGSDAAAAAFATGHQAGYEEGYQVGYAEAACARLDELIKTPRP